MVTDQSSIGIHEEVGDRATSLRFEHLSPRQSKQDDYLRRLSPRFDFTSQVHAGNARGRLAPGVRVMAKTESTAVNQLIANVSGRPLEPADHDELGFEERTLPSHEPVRRSSGPAVARTPAPA